MSPEQARREVSALAHAIDAIKPTAGWDGAEVAQLNGHIFATRMAISQWEESPNAPAYGAAVSEALQKLRDIIDKPDWAPAPKNVGAPSAVVHSL